MPPDKTQTRVEAIAEVREILLTHLADEAAPTRAALVAAIRALDMALAQIKDDADLIEANLLEATQ